jgi:hypothetical protein
MSHLGASYAETKATTELVQQLVGGLRWVARESHRRDCDV